MRPSAGTRAPQGRPHDIAGNDLRSRQPHPFAIAQDQRDGSQPLFQRRENRRRPAFLDEAERCVEQEQGGDDSRLHERAKA